ncbi:MAG: glutamyl-tRNA reductase [Anaerolineae bacterium]
MNTIEVTTTGKSSVPMNGVGCPSTLAGGVLAVGLNHKIAPVEVRERLAVSASHLPGTLGQLLGIPGVEEAAVLSTCNRLELYVAADGATSTRERITSFLAQRAGLEVKDLAAYLYVYEGDACARHLGRVAAGLDSLLVGEYEIQGQVKGALQAAVEAGASKAKITALFQHALRAGKMVRTRTDIGLGEKSLADVVVWVAEEHLTDLASRKALVIGAGKMGKLAARTLARSGFHWLFIANRTFDKARELAAEVGGDAVHFDGLAGALRRADLVVSSTGAPHIVLHEADVRAALEGRGGARLVVLDLAVPRDVDPAVANLPGVALYDMDDLIEVVARRHPVAAPAMAAAEAIVERMVEEYCTWLHEREMAPLICALRAQAEAIRQGELEKALSRLQHLSERDQEVVRALSKSLTHKLLHTPTARLKECNAPEAHRYAEAAAFLFDLEEAR